MGCGVWITKKVGERRPLSWSAVAILAQMPLSLAMGNPQRCSVVPSGLLLR
jgi:hypothetical protein